VHRFVSLLQVFAVLVVPAPGVPSYQVELSGNADGATWSGRETIGFTNTSADPLPEVYLRLWGMRTVVLR
jgi:hypothetical protein